MNKFINIEVEGELTDIKPGYTTIDGEYIDPSVGIITGIDINKGKDNRFITYDTIAHPSIASIDKYKENEYDRTD